MNDLVNKLSAPILALSSGRRWAVGMAVCISVAAFGLLIMLANKTNYKPLFANLSTEDAGEIVKKLKEQKVSYQIAGDGRAILVPAEKVYDLRLSMASEGLPQGGGVGFEIFDRKNFGVTEFVQKLNYQRALQGELARTIMQISGIEHARVHLAIPEKSLFRENDKKASASVVLRLKPGKQLGDSEVQGIVHLLASSVEGANPDEISVIDSKGKILSHNGSAGKSVTMSSKMQEMQQTYEKSLEERLQGLLDKAVGSGGSVARVTALLNFKQVEKVEERFDPDAAALRSEQRSEQKEAAAATAGGVAGAQQNLGKATTPAATTGGGSKSDETLNYEVSHSTAKIIEPVGNLTKLSVAIMVDGKYEAAPPAKPGKPAAKPKYIPRSAEELQKIEGLVKSAIGFDAARGDQVTVANVPFQEIADDSVVEAPKWWEKPVFIELVKNLLLGMGFIALLLLVVKPLLKTAPQQKRAMRNDFEPLSPEQAMPRPRGEKGQARLAIKSANQMELIDSVKQDPYQTAQILSNWIKQE